jgi:Protein O-mannosyl-transferase TMEM260-like
MKSVPASPPNAPRVDARAVTLWLAAVTVSVAALVVYRSTLLPGVDFGDSGSIQTTVGESLLTPRNGYPVYFAIGAVVMKLTGAAPAYAMNLTSAVEGAVACGLLVIVAAELTGSIVAAVAGALLFAFSYTFWSQSVTAEVYALHICFVLASVLLLLRWEREPSTARLAAFFGCYALGFGNHLSMILLLPGFALFLLTSEPRGWRSLFSPSVVALATAAAAAGALPYLWNIGTLWFMPDPPASIWAALRTFWFDVTKSDWRDTMVLNVPGSMVRDHAAMYWFDLRQQFGVAVVMLAAAGAAALTARHRRRAFLLGLLFLVNLFFAFSYNVGDTHVFYLPSHLIVSLLTAYAVAWIATVWNWRWSIAAAVALLLYACARLYHDFPALDRSADTRAQRVLERFTSNVDDQHAIVLVDLNWQVANGLSYFTKVITPQVVTVRMREVLLFAPALIRDNVADGRDVVMTEQAANILAGSYGPLFSARSNSPDPTLRDFVRDLPPGTRYALCVLKPTRDFQLDRADLDAALRKLGASASVLPAHDYYAITGRIGERPVLIAQDNRPFTRMVDVDGVPTEIRMDSWLSADTIRRMGFAHVIANHRHTLIVERGVSFVAFDDRGRPIRTAYFSNIFAELRRLIIGTNQDLPRDTKDPP